MTPPLRLELPSPRAGRISAMDELKGVAIALVILYHAGGVLAWANTLHGEVGVDIFVVLSGMGLGLSSTREGAGRFLLRRFWRVYPAYWIVLTAFLIGDAFVLDLHFSGEDIVLHYLGIQTLFGDAYAMSINDSFWFVTLIVLLYSLYALLRRFMARPDIMLLAGAVVSFGLALSYLKANQPVAFAHFSLRIPGFFLGVLAGRLLRNGLLEIPLSWALALACFLLLYVPYLCGFVFGTFWTGLALMAFYAYLLRPVLPAAVLGVLRYLGDRSLEIYLLHQPLIRSYNIYFQTRWLGVAGLTPTGIIIGMAAGLAVTLALSDGLHWLLKRLSMPAWLQATPAQA